MNNVPSWFIANRFLSIWFLFYVKSLSKVTLFSTKFVLKISWYEYSLRQYFNFLLLLYRFIYLVLIFSHSFSHLYPISVNYEKNEYKNDLTNYAECN